MRKAPRTGSPAVLVGSVDMAGDWTEEGAACWQGEEKAQRRAVRASVLRRAEADV